MAQLDTWMKVALVSIGFSPPGIDEVREEYFELANSIHYRHYARYRSRIDAGMEELIARIVDELQTFYGSLSFELTNHEDLYDSASKRSQRFAVATLVVVSFTIILGFAAWTPGAGIRTTTSSVLGLCLAASFWTLRGRAKAVAIRTEAENAALKVQLQRKTSTSVKEAFTQVLNETLGPENILPFPTVAPRLVELNTSAIVPSSTAILLKTFVEGHKSSAIGIAGPRGSGKSTLMRALTTTAEHRARSVLLTAPVRYDSVDFIRRLYFEVAMTVDARNGGQLRKLRRRRKSLVKIKRLMFGMTLVVFGSLLSVYEPLYTNLFPQQEMSATGVASLILFFSGAVVMFLGMLQSWFLQFFGFGGGLADGQKYSSVLAGEAITRLTYDRETNSKSKNTLKFFGSSLALEDENSVTLKDRALSHADLVAQLRELLQAFAHDEGLKPVIVVIDELDKISLTTGLVDTINDLKDLFHIEGVHFLVSVSTDALLSFEQRGLISRDAFDSSFDTIVPVLALTMDESIQVISARAEGFPPLVSAFCHAWSGGLPRELLRVARRCVEIQRSTPEAQRVEYLVRTVIAEDIISLAEAAMRSTTSADKRDYLVRLRQRGRALRVGDVSPSPSVVVPKSLRRITNVATLGEELIIYFAKSVMVGTAQWSTPDPVREPIEAAAKAMALRAEHEEIRTEAFEKAKSLLMANR